MQCFLLGNKYIELFQKFNDVVASCFGQSLDENYQVKIVDFHQAILKNKINFTPKLHACIYHIPEFISMKQKPLGFYSEQASESVHFAYAKHSENYKITQKSGDYDQKFLRSVTTFNALRQ